MIGIDVVNVEAPPRVEITPGSVTVSKVVGVVSSIADDLDGGIGC